MDNKIPFVEIPQEIRAYLEGLMEDAHVIVTDDKEKEQVVQYLFDKLDKYMAAKIVENMSAEDTETYIQMNEQKKPREEVDAFLKEHIKNPEEVFARAFVDFRDFYLTGQQGPTTSAPRSEQNPAN